MAWDSGAPNTSLLTTYLIKKFIPALEDELQFQKFTTKATIPAGMGNVARWNVFSSPAANTTALTEGTVSGNEITTLTTTGTDATIAEYGEFIVVTRLMDYCQVSGARSELSDRMSYGGARSIDSLVRAQALTTTTAAYCQNEMAGATATATAGSDPFDPGSASALIYCGAQLRGNSARGFRGVKGHPDGAFAAILTPTFEQDMVQEATAGRMTWAQAVTAVPGTMGQEKWVNGYMGSVYGTACYRTQNFSTTVITITGENNYVLAEGGIGSVSIIDADPTVMVNTASSGDVGNPYRNRNTVSWHAYFATALIDSNRVVRLYSEE
jgi:N4-gp56 family major capsid protein